MLKWVMFRPVWYLAAITSKTKFNCNNSIDLKQILALDYRAKYSESFKLVTGERIISYGDFAVAKVKIYADNGQKKWTRRHSPEIYGYAKKSNLIDDGTIAKIDRGDYTRSSVSGGTFLNENILRRRYQVLFVLIPILPQAVIQFILKQNLVRWIPLINPVLLVNFTKFIKPNKFDEFRVRGIRMPLYEIPRLIINLIKKYKFDFTFSDPDNINLYGRHAKK